MKVWSISPQLLSIRCQGSAPAEPDYYPANLSGKGSRIRVTPDAGIRFTKMADGTVRGFRDYAEEIYTISVEHFWLTANDRDAVIAYYDDALTSLRVLITDEGAFDVYFVNRPQITDKSGALYTVVSNLIGTKQ